MKKKKLTIILLTLLAFFVFFPMQIQRIVFSIEWWYLSNFEGKAGLYNSYLDEFYCTDNISCLHEQGHSQDRSLGRVSDIKWYSNTLEFQENISILTECRIPGLSQSQLPFIQLILRVTNANDWQEIYAKIYSTVELREYITLEKLIEDYANQCVF